MDGGLTGATWALFGAALLTFGGIFYQALLTRRVAEATRQDVEAQWRPLLVPAEQGADDASVWWGLLADDLFSFRMENVGKGPALAIQGYELALPVTDGALSQFPCNELVSPVLSVNQTVTLRRRNASLDGNRLRFQIDYTDLGGRLYRTWVVYQRVDAHQAWSVENVTPEAPRPRKRFWLF